MDGKLLGARIKSRRIELDMTQGDIADAIGVAISTIQRYETGSIQKIKLPVVEAVARHLRVNANWLIGKSEIKEPSEALNDRTHAPSPRIATDVVSFPIITSVAAHYDSMSFNESGVEGDSVEIPEKYLRGRPASDYCVMRVKGDSMYPDFRDGDLVLVLLQATFNRPRDIGVIAYGDDETTIKRIDYVMGEDWLELIPINPTYPPKRIADAELERCRVIGIPKLLIREL